MHLSPFTILSNGARGVPLFFILSGFVLYLPYVLEQRTLDGWKDVFVFYKRRARRLLPLYYIHILILAAVLRSDLSPLETFSNLFWTGTFLMPFHKLFDVSYVYNGNIWSLGIEVWFCILMPFIIWASRRIGMRTIILLFTILSLVLRVCYPYEGSSTLGFMLLDFIIGMAIAQEYGRKRSTNMRNPWLAVGIIISAFAFLISDVIAMEQAPLALLAINEIIVVIGFALFVYGILLTKLKAVRILFTNWPIQMIGMMCYSLYLWHGPSLYPLQPSLSIYRFVRFIFLTFSISFLSYRYIEFGFVKDIRMLLPRRHHTHRHISPLSANSPFSGALSSTSLVRCTHRASVICNRFTVRKCRAHRISAKLKSRKSGCPRTEPLPAFS